MTIMGPTPSQTIGPFFRFGMAWMQAPDLVPPSSPGAVKLVGRIVDGAGEPMPDAMVEIWQADGRGRFPPAVDPAWTGFGRSLTDGEGRFRFTTVKPGRVDDLQAPHIDVSVFGRGLLQRLVTRIYFPDETSANDADPVLRSIDDPVARATLVAADDGSRLRFDIHAQGDRETVFFVY
jgi:protocatechuate 3,4-dioxygenase, alpha subunit